MPKRKELILTYIMMRDLWRRESKYWIAGERSKYSTSKTKTKTKNSCKGACSWPFRNGLCEKEEKMLGSSLTHALFHSTSNSAVQANARHSRRSYFCFVSCRFWHLNEPNLPEERCASVVHWDPTGWGWNDVVCESKYNSICEMKKTYLWAAFYPFMPLESLGTNT